MHSNGYLNLWKNYKLHNFPIGKKETMPAKPVRKVIIKTVTLSLYEMNKDGDLYKSPSIFNRKYDVF